MAEQNTYTKMPGNLYLVRDGMQMWLAEKRSSKGKDYYRRCSGYYTSYQSLLDGYVREQGLQNGGKDVAATLKEFADLEQKLRQLARALGKELDNENQQENQRL